MSSNKENSVLNNNLKKIVEEYSGYKVQKILIIPDPQVPNSYSIKTSRQFNKSKELYDWFFVNYNPKTLIVQIHLLASIPN